MDLKNFVFSTLNSDELERVASTLFAGDRQYSQIEIKSLLEKQGILDKITEDFINIVLNKGTDIATNENIIIETNKQPVDEKVGLRLSLQNGRAFLYQPDSPCLLHVEILCLNQRFSSSRQHASVDPIFGNVFNVNLPSAELSVLVEIMDPIHLVLLQTDSNGTRTLLATRTVEWRQVLHTKSMSKLVELTAINDSQITVGLLELEIALVGKPILLTKDDFDFQMRKETQSNQDSDRIFFGYAKQWWSDYLFINPALFKSRLVKIFACTETRKEIVTNFLTPLKIDLISPAHAARFVSLIPLEKPMLIADARNDVWQDLHTFLSVGKGDIQDHALLLCSLLLGFHLDAYITVGLGDQNYPCMWITTIDSDMKVLFWDSVTGITYIQQQKNIPFRNVGCCFHNNAFYANLQTSDDASTTNFDFANEKLWKCMSVKAISSCKLSKNNFQFQAISQSKISEGEIELALKQRIKAYRHDHGLIQSSLIDATGLSWHEDEEMGYLIPQLLQKNEMEKLYGKSDDTKSNNYFSMGIKRLIPQSHTFKGYPANFNHSNIDAIFAALKKKSACREVMLARGDVVRFAVRVMKFEYIEGVCSWWIMVAVRFRAVGGKGL